MTKDTQTREQELIDAIDNLKKKHGGDYSRVYRDIYLTAIKSDLARKYHSSVEVDLKTIKLDIIKVLEKRLGYGAMEILSFENSTQDIINLITPYLQQPNEYLIPLQKLLDSIDEYVLEQRNHQLTRTPERMSTIECVADWCKKFAINLKNSNIQPTEEQAEINGLMKRLNDTVNMCSDIKLREDELKKQLSDLNDKYQKVLNLACPLLNKLKEKGEPVELYAIADIINKDKIK